MSSYLIFYRKCDEIYFKWMQINSLCQSMMILRLWIKLMQSQWSILRKEIKEAPCLLDNKWFYFLTDAAIPGNMIVCEYLFQVTNKILHIRFIGWMRNHRVTSPHQKFKQTIRTRLLTVLKRSICVNQNMLWHISEEEM